MVLNFYLTSCFFVGFVVIYFVEKTLENKNNPQAFNALCAVPLTV